MFDWRRWRDLPWADAIMFAAPFLAAWAFCWAYAWLMAGCPHG